MEFAKLHGLGNDFVIAKTGESDGSRPSLSVMAKRICNRHCGIGADGVVFYQATKNDREADFSSLIFNADGSKAEMSGNGIRCLAAHVLHKKEHASRIVRIRTISGIRMLTLKGQEGPLYRFECSMGQPITEAAKVPARIEGTVSPVVNYPLHVGQDLLKVSICSMGNPHCSTFWPDVTQAPIDRLGPALEAHPIFPNRANVEFIEVIDRTRLKVRFWERGCGRTLSSGTGSSAAAVAAILGHLADTPLIVETDLGSLEVEWQVGRELYLTGPAEFICSGDYPAGVEGA